MGYVYLHPFCFLISFNIFYFMNDTITLTCISYSIGRKSVSYFVTFLSLVKFFSKLIPFKVLGQRFQKWTKNRTGGLSTYIFIAFDRRNV